MHAINAHQQNRTPKMFLVRELRVFYYAVKIVKHGLFFISNGITDQLSIALYFHSLAPEFERVFGKAI